jgi:hypothetical protein
VPPVHAHEMHGAVGRCTCRCRQTGLQKGHEVSAESSPDAMANSSCLTGPARQCRSREHCTAGQGTPSLRRRPHQASQIIILAASPQSRRW